MTFSTRFLSALLTMFLISTSFILAQVGTQVPINPSSIPQFVDPLPHFAGNRVNAKAGGDVTVQMVPHQQIALSTGTPVTGGIVGANPTLGLANVWAYSIKYEDGEFTPPLWPGFTIDAYRGNELEVTYLNKLGGQRYSDVGLIADQTLHWANPLEASMMAMTAYTGPVPTVAHLHGGEVASESDGGPDAWFTPSNDPSYPSAITGPSWGMGNSSKVVDQIYDYPNTQEEATLWFHDHALGATRLNVYAGLEAFYLLRGPEEESAHLPGWSGDNTVLEVAPLGTSGTFNPDPYLPEIEIAIQDRMFDMDGKLYFVNNMPTNPMDHPFWNPEFVGDVITVNGKTWPYLSVAPRAYRFRVLNGSNARFYDLWLQDLVTGAFGPTIYQIGTDGGLLDAPVAINPNLGGKLLLGPGERADIVIDFSASAPGAVWTIRNSGRTPYPKGGTPQATTLGRIMQFVVNGTMTAPDLSSFANGAVPASLRNPLVKLTNFAGATTTVPDVTRQLTLNEVMGMGGPLEVLVNNTKWDANGMNVSGLGITETPTEGNTEVWKIINLTADAHPIHLHLVQFQLVNRQNFNFNKYNKAYSALFPGGAGFIGAYGPPKPYDFYFNGGLGWYGGNPDVTPYLQGPVNPANPNERGWKDTFIMYPGEVTTVVVRFAPTDLPINTSKADLVFAFDPSEGPGYVWHCHIIDHEDNEMMRPYTVNPNISRFSKIGPSVADATVTSYELAQNYPNPFNPSTIINFSVPDDQFVSLKVYNSIGAEIGTLLNREVPKGNHKVEFDASGLASGMYFYTLNAGKFNETRKMILLK